MIFLWGIQTAQKVIRGTNFYCRIDIDYTHNNNKQFHSEKTPLFGWKMTPHTKSLCAIEQMKNNFLISPHNLITRDIKIEYFCTIPYVRVCQYKCNIYTNRLIFILNDNHKDIPPPLCVKWKCIVTCSSNIHNSIIIIISQTWNLSEKEFEISSKGCQENLI